MAVLFPAESAAAAELKPETLQAWEQYVKGADGAMKRRAEPNGRFLGVDEARERMGRIRGGAVVVHPMAAHTPQRVPSGLIHHWVGAVFIPHTRIEDVFGVTRDYERYQERYRPAVVGSAALSRFG